MKIQNSPSGTIFSSPSGYRAYVPNPLPPAIPWSNELVYSLSQADYILGKLAREGAKLPNPHLLIRPFMAKEAVLSSKIEGTRTTLGEILSYNASVEARSQQDDLQEVLNYIVALEEGIDLLEKLPLSLRLIKEIHKILMRNARSSFATPGEFRKSQNWIGLPGCTLNTAKYVPPPIELLLDCLTDFENFLHNRNLPPLIHAGLLHYQFEAIHPFLDGNGRVGRLLITLLLIEQNILPTPLLYLSAFFEATRDDYYRQLFSVSAEGTWHDWLIYFLNGVATQAEDALNRASNINEHIETWKLLMAQKTSNNVIHSIIDKFATNPFLSTKKVAADLGIAYTTAQRGINALLKEGIIEQVGDKKRGKLYCATVILDILETPTVLSI